ncbi:MAG TPA: TfoX/Sxy family protein [Candidatus Kapabacteria bacterium]|nr:TfoX/Sxy family protein [Candidatus Kapabacteria bacterium]
MKRAADEFDEFVRFVIEQMGRDLRPRVRRMFGGYGLYRDDLMFAIIIQDKLYLKTDDVNRREFEEKGLLPFTYESKGKPVTIRYYEAPPEVFDDRDDMQAWAASAVAAALRARRQ